MGGGEPPDGRGGARAAPAALHAQKQAVRAAEGRLSRLPGSARALAERLSDLCEPIEAALHELNAAHAPSIERGDGSRGTGSF